MFHVEKIMCQTEVLSACGTHTTAFCCFFLAIFFSSFFKGGNGFLTLKMKELETSFQFLVQKLFFFFFWGLYLKRLFVLRYSVSASILL